MDPKDEVSSGTLRAFNKLFFFLVRRENDFKHVENDMQILYHEERSQIF